MPFDSDLYQSNAVDTYKKLWDCQPIELYPDSELVYKPIERPQLVILDVRALLTPFLLISSDTLKVLVLLCLERYPQHKWKGCSYLCVAVLRFSSYFRYLWTGKHGWKR